MTLNRFPLFPKSWGKISQQREWILVMDFFFDDSGKETWEQEEYVCIAGYLGFETFVDLYVNLLINLLLRHNISCIHMRDLIYLQGEYKKLVGTN